MRAGHTSRGLTLIEVLVAMAILAICMLALLPFFGLSVKTNASSGQLATANTLAKEKLEELICYPSTDPRLAIPAGQTMATGDAGATYNANCANDLPGWYNPTTGQTKAAGTANPGSGWYPYPLQRTVHVQAFSLSDALAAPKTSTSFDETGFIAAPATCYYDVKLVTVTVQPASGPLPGLRKTVQSAYVKFRGRL